MLLSLLLIFFNSCMPERLNIVDIEKFELIGDSTSIRLYGEVVDFNKKQGISQHGFCYSAERFPEINRDSTINLGAYSANEAFFMADLNGQPGKNYFVRAFVIVDGKVHYSPLRNFRTRSARLGDLDIAIEFSAILGDSLVVQGFSNKVILEKNQQANFIQYGSIVNNVPDSTSGLSSANNVNNPDNALRFREQFYLPNLPNFSSTTEIFVWTYAIARNNKGEERRLFSKRQKMVLP